MAPIKHGRNMFTVRYHGNYVGPGWSGGKYGKSVAFSKVRPIDAFDRTSMVHDRKYALGMNKKLADYEFYKANIGKGVKRSVAAIAVGTQGYLRLVLSFLKKIIKWRILVLQELLFVL